MAPSPFGARLTLLRQSRKISVSELARQAGLDYMQIRRYEAGKTSPTLDSAMRIAIVLDIPLDELAGRTAAPPSPKIRNERLLDAMRALDKMPADRQEMALRVLDTVITGHALEELSERLKRG